MYGLEGTIKKGVGMRLSKKHQDMNHKKPQRVKKSEKVQYKLDEPLKNPNAKEADWQLEERALKQRNKNQLR